MVGTESLSMIWPLCWERSPLEVPTNRVATWSAVAALALSPLAPTTITSHASASTQAASTQQQTYNVTARTNSKTAIGGEDTVKVTGRVTPSAAGQKVILQQRVGKKRSWKATATATIERTGTYVLKDRPTTPGTRQYRVVKPASAGISKGMSKPLSVAVYAWRTIGRQSPGPTTNVDIASAVIATDSYVPSWVTQTAGYPGSFEYTLGRSCLRLRATYALTDDSATGSSGSVTVSTDGAARVTHALVVGTVVADHVLDITGALSIRFDLTSTGPTPAGMTGAVGKSAVAAPEVLCTR